MVLLATQTSRCKQQSKMVPFSFTFAMASLLGGFVEGLQACCYVPNKHGQFNTCLFCMVALENLLSTVANMQAKSHLLYSTSASSRLSETRLPPTRQLSLDSKTHTSFTHGSDVYTMTRYANNMSSNHIHSFIVSLGGAARIFECMALGGAARIFECMAGPRWCCTDI